MHMRAAPAEAMNSDFEELLSIFNANGVRYLIVGGHAVMLYTEPRYTKNLDVWIDASAENARAVYRSLLTFGAPLAGLSAKDFAEEGSFYQMGIPPARVDILMSINGVTFAEAWPNWKERCGGWRLRGTLSPIRRAMMRTFISSCAGN